MSTFLKINNFWDEEITQTKHLSSFFVLNESIFTVDMDPKNDL
jgi:hypothetical protein